MFKLLIYLLFKVYTLNEQDWERLEQENVLASVQQAFSFGRGSGENGTVHNNSTLQMPPSESMLSGGLDFGLENDGGFDTLNGTGTEVPSDAQQLARLLQKQLEAINDEIRMIQEHKITSDTRSGPGNGQLMLDSSKPGLNNRSLGNIPVSGPPAYSMDSIANRSSPQPPPVPPPMMSMGGRNPMVNWL